MEETAITPQEEVKKAEVPFVLPPHRNRMVWAILCTIFCCQLGGIIAIIYSARSNSLYTSATFTTDNTLKTSLYYQSEEKNRTARIWNIVSLVSGGIGYITYAILLATGTLASLMSI